MKIDIYRFGGGTADGSASMKDLLGGKGANLAEMASLGLPVPPGFTLPTTACTQYQTNTSTTFVPALEEALNTGLDAIRKALGKQQFLVSVRSGARVSMPGMMDTILNVGITSKTLPRWKKALGERAALDSYRRLIQMLGSVALGIPMEKFEQCLDNLKVARKVTQDSELTADALSTLVEEYLKVVKGHGIDFPDTYAQQLAVASLAVFDSWGNERAKEYRKINDIPEDWGTAVNVQAMVFGNLNDQSATGVLFSRNPSTGNPDITGEFLVNAQGEDVVAGIRTPEPLEKLAAWNSKVDTELQGHVFKLENHYRDMQDVEFTVEDGKLYILQTRNAKRSAQAAFKVAYDMTVEGLITKQEATQRVTAKQLFTVMQDRIDPSFTTPPTFQGIAAGGGLVTGVVVLSSAAAVNCKEPCILVTQETNPDDIAGMNAAVGIFTATGGLTSHAAVVGRGMNKTCVVGATDLKPGINLNAGQMVTLDGLTGRVWVDSKVPVIPGGASAEVVALAQWMQDYEHTTRVELSASMKVADFEKAILAALQGDMNKPLHFDLCKLDGPDLWSTESKKIYARYLDLFKAIKNLQDYTGPIHLSMAPAQSYASASDAVFDFMFAIDEERIKLAQVNKGIMLRIYLEAPLGLKERVYIKDPEDKDKYLEKGFKVMGQMETFADLLSDQPLAVTEESILKVFGTKDAYQLALELLAMKGKTLPPTLPVARYWYDAITSQGA